jgi:signal transduction histidine kinase
MLARSWPVRLSMAVAIAVIAALAYWDAVRESEGALSDFASEQATLARGIAAAISGRVRNLDAAHPGEAEAILRDVRSVESPSKLRLLIVKPNAPGMRTTDGRVVRDAEVERALERGLSWVRIDRGRAPGFELPRRTAIAGLASFEGPSGRWSVVVVTTALRERDRELRAQWRSVSGVVLASGLVLLFGGFAMRKQRKELELARELAVSELRRERERQLVQIDKLATLAALATGIAHEVSTPLGVIVGRAEQLLARVLGDERATKAAVSIIDQGTRIGRVVRGFLSLARGDSPVLEHANPGALARAAAELVEHRFEKAGVTLAVRIGEEMPEIACDPRLVEQAVINLLLNACDACEPGGQVELAVSSDGRRVAFVVTDDGVGITEEAAARATEPFFTTKPAGKGTGLGLAIANEIAKHHGGELSIAPRARGPAGQSVRGTRACIELPTTTRSPSDGEAPDAVDRPAPP